ncbi:hypothetical protein Taro_026219 [Colocasia esculenta]|uniref:Uncharacterized protein n=1 Tax=Colocasia esculenta TaxID=4460 RepID=A0A843VMZ0_COLES|nr:hypothetical protein [Colocasia esculenta]
MGSVDTPFTGVDTMLQTQEKIIQNWSSSVDTSSVDTRDSSRNNLLANLGQCVDTSSSSVDTRGLPRTPFGLFWDSVSTLAQVVSTLEPSQNKTHRAKLRKTTIFPSRSPFPQRSKLATLDPNLLYWAVRDPMVTTTTAQASPLRSPALFRPVVSTLKTAPRTTFWPIWDSVSTLAQVVSTLEAFPEHLLGCFGTVCRH